MVENLIRSLSDYDSRMENVQNEILAVVDNVNTERCIGRKA